MRTHRLFAPFEASVDDAITLEGNAAHYLSRVLRLSEGAEVVLFNGDGHDYACCLEAFSRGQVVARVIERTSNGCESPLKLTLSQALSRGERMDYSLQKATELGVHAIQLLTSERVELRLKGERLAKRMAHWQGVLTSASEQCGRATVPELRAPITLETWSKGPGTRLVLDAAAAESLARVAPAQALDLAIGPEGGFSESELAMATGNGATAVSMGPRILRTETAGPAAIAVLQSVAGDFA